MKKVINVICLGIPYIWKCLKIVHALKEKIDIDKNGKITADEIKYFIDSWETIKGE